MILQLTMPRSEQQTGGAAAVRGTEWLEEIRSYWAGRDAQRAEEAGSVAACAQRALAEAMLGLHGAPVPEKLSDPSEPS